MLEAQEEIGRDVDLADEHQYTLLHTSRNQSSHVFNQAGPERDALIN